MPETAQHSVLEFLPIDIRPRYAIASANHALAAFRMHCAGLQRYNPAHQFAVVPDTEIRYHAACARYRPLARMQLHLRPSQSDILRELRWFDPCLRSGFTIYMWERSLQNRMVLLPPCTWCGMPTGGTCEGCLKRAEIAGDAHSIPNRLCNICANEWYLCRFCDGNRPELSGAGSQEFQESADI